MPPPGIVVSPAIEEVFTTCPRPASIMAGTKARMPLATPSRLTSRVHRQSSGVLLPQRPARGDDAGVVAQHVDPAELAQHPFGEAVDRRRGRGRRPATPTAVAPLPSSSRTAASSESGSTSASTTVRPRAAKASTMRPADAAGAARDDGDLAGLEPHDGQLRQHLGAELLELGHGVGVRQPRPVRLVDEVGHAELLAQGPELVGALGRRPEDELVLDVGAQLGPVVDRGVLAREAPLLVGLVAGPVALQRRLHAGRLRRRDQQLAAEGEVAVRWQARPRRGCRGRAGAAPRARHAVGNGGAYHASPIRAARLTAPAAWPPTQTGMPPSCSGQHRGLGAVHAVKNSPSKSTVSPLQSRRTSASDSSNRATLVPFSTPNAANSCAAVAQPDAEDRPPVGEHVEGGHLLGDLDRVDHRQQHDAGGGLHRRRDAAHVRQPRHRLEVAQLRAEEVLAADHQVEAELLGGA